ncbi:MAG: hypothetical protein ACLGJB_25365 [Blastocatellia bacterium]
MHDCHKTSGRIIDLIFDEMGPVEGSLLREEVSACERCLNQYRSMTETLLAFDDAAETLAPDENYWGRYNQVLTERIVEQARPKVKKRWAHSFFKFAWLPGAAIPAAIGVVIISLAAGLIITRSKGMADAPPALSGEAARDSEPVSVSEPAGAPIKSGPERSRSVAKSTSVTARKPRPKVAAPVSNDKAIDLAAHINAARLVRRDLTPADVETGHHVEQAQSLLRAIKNARVATGQSVYDAFLERQLAREILSDNILLKRSAELKGNLRAEEILTDLEPFLLDIANLPDKAPQQRLRQIQDLLQKEQIIITLQLYSSQTSGERL